MDRKFDKKRIIKITVSVAAFAVIAWLMMTGRMEGFDRAVQDLFFSFRRDWLASRPV